MQIKLLIISFAIFRLTYAQGTWTQKANFGGTARANAVGFSIGTKGYFGTGWDSIAKNDLWEYDPNLNSWSQRASLPGEARFGAVGFSIGTKGYIGTGKDNSFNDLNDFWEYDPSSNNWSQKANFGGTPRYLAVGLSIGTKGYIGTGDYLNGTSMSDFWEWNQATNIWTQKANFGGAARIEASGFSIGEKGYIGTGATSSAPSSVTYFSDFWEWDQTTNIWTLKSSFGGGGRVGVECSAFAIGSKGYMGVGNNEPNYYNDFWEYDPSIDTWTQKLNFGSSGRIDGTGFTIGSKGYLGIGYNGTLQQDFWEYDPSGISSTGEIISNFSLTIFPNPFSSQTTLQTGKFLKDATLIVYNLFGQQIKQLKNISGQTITFDRDNISNGIYFLQLKQDNKILATVQFVIADK